MIVLMEHRLGRCKKRANRWRGVTRSSPVGHGLLSTGTRVQMRLPRPIYTTCTNSYTGTYPGQIRGHKSRTDTTFGAIVGTTVLDGWLNGTDRQ